jgi:hypothetical protein
MLSIEFSGFSFQLNSVYLDKCHICFSCPCFVFFKSSLTKRTTMKLGVGEYDVLQAKI